MKRTLLTLLLLVGCALAAERAKSLYKVSHVSQSIVAVSCLNGGNPTAVQNAAGDYTVVLISCGQ